MNGRFVEKNEQKMLTHGPDFGRKQNSPSGNNSVVECNLAKVEVAGSNPVSRSIQSAQARPKAWLFRPASDPSALFVVSSKWFSAVVRVASKKFVSK